MAGETVLIIDDNQKTLAALTDALQSQGYMPLTASNGQQGLRLALENEPDLLLLNPTLPRSILIGKNLAIWLYNFLLFIICIVIWSVLVQIPSPFTLLTAILLFSISLLAFTTAGNFISILFPIRRDMSTIRNQPSQVGILLSLFSFSVIAGIIAFFLFIPLFLGMKFLQLIFLAALMIIQIGVYSLTLKLSSRLMGERKEKMIEALKEKS